MRLNLHNVFIGIFEETHIYPLIKQKVLLYLRYIWHIFHMDRFSKRTVKFDFSYSKTQIHFLGITIKKRSIGRHLITFENQGTLKLLNEAYPIHALWLKRIYTTKEDFTEQSKVLIKRLVIRGYNETMRMKYSNKFQRQDPQYIIYKRFF